MLSRVLLGATRIPGLRTRLIYPVIPLVSGTLRLRLNSTAPKQQPKPILDTKPEGNPKQKAKPDPKPSSTPKQKQKPNGPKADTRTHLEKFFASYTGAKYDPSKPILEQFNNMCRMYGWRKKSPQEKKRKDYDKKKDRWQQARGALDNAMARQFNQVYGKSTKDLAAWQKLCHTLNHPNVPNDSNKCKEFVRSLYVNIVDLLESRHTGARVKRYPTEKELSDYSLETDKIISRKNIHAGNLLKHLLRRIFNPSKPDDEEGDKLALAPKKELGRP